MMTLRCPQCGRTYPYDRRKTGYSILCATPGCQTIIPVKSLISPWLIASALGVIGALGIGYFFEHSAVMQSPTEATTRVPQASPIVSANPAGIKSSVPTRHEKALQHDMIGTFIGVNKAIGQKQTETGTSTSLRLNGLPPTGYVPSPAEIRRTDQDWANGQRRRHQTDQPTDLKAVVYPTALPATISLLTGMDVAPAINRNGMGELTIVNGTRQDAVVKLAAPLGNNGRLVAFRSVYVKAQEQYTIKQIGEGSYSVFFALGDDWDQAAQAFRQSNTYSHFEKTLRFTETTSQSETDNGYRTGTQYNTFRITLNPVVNGNVRANTTDRATFDALNR